MLNPDLITTTYLPYLEHQLTPHRLQHSLNVMQIMSELADLYGLDREQAMVAGLLHDAAREISPARQIDIAVQAGIGFRYPCERHDFYLHGPVGAHIIERYLGVDDPLILGAIESHCYSGSTPYFDTTFSWCLRFADLMEPARTFPGVEKFRRVVRSGRLQEAALLDVGWGIELLQRLTWPIHPNLQQSYERLSAHLQVDDAFFARE